VPPPLQIDRAAQLNDAYGQDEPLAHLYAAHRRLALSHGPLGQRLEVMRQLSQADPSPFWDKDIRQFEQARFKQLRVMFASAVSAKDSNAVREVASEVLDSPWLEQPPQDLASAAREVHDRVQLAKAGTELAGVLEELRAAYAAKSLSKCTALLAKVKELGQLHGAASLSTDAARDVKVVATWVQKQEQVQAARKAHAANCDALGQAIDANAKGAALESAYRAVAENPAGVPPELAERYEALLRRRARSAWLVYAAGFLVLLAGVGVTLLVIHQRNEAANAAAWAKRIDDAVNQRNISLGKQLIEEQQKLAPQYNEVAAVAAAKKRLTDLGEQVARDRVQGEKDRQAVATAVNRLDAAAQAAGSAIQSAATATPDTLLTAARAADDAIAAGQRDATELQKIDPDGSLAAQIRRLEGRRDELRRLAGNWVTTRAASAARVAAAIVVDPTAASLADAETRFAQAETEMASVRPFVARLPDVQAAVQAAETTLANRRDSIRSARAEFDARAALAESAVTVPSARAALRDFAQRFPQSALSRDFTVAADVAEGCEAVFAWQKLTTPWTSNPLPSSDKGASQRLLDVRAYLAAHPTSPLAGQAATYASFLEAAIEATAAQNTWQLALADILASPMMSELRVFKASDGAVYWVLGDPGLKTQGPLGRMRYTFQVVDPQNTARRKTVNLAPPVSLTSERPAPAPHVAYVRALSEQLKAVDPDRWDLWGVDLIEAVARDESIDTIVKAILLREVIRSTAKATQWAVGPLYDRVLNDLDRQRLDQVVWYDHENPVSDVLTSNLKAIFARIPKTEEARRLLAAKRTELTASLRPAYEGLGLMMKDEQGNWQVLTPAKGRIGETAVAVVTSARVEQSTVPADGEWQPGRPIAGIELAQAAPSGRGTLFQLPGTRPAARAAPATRPAALTRPAAASVSPPAPTSQPAAVAPATLPAAEPLAPLPPAPLPPPVVDSPAPPSVRNPLTPAAPSATFVVVARRVNGKMVPEANAVRLLPQGTIVLFSLP
jgi:hypothetical protein